MPTIPTEQKAQVANFKDYFPNEYSGPLTSSPLLPEIYEVKGTITRPPFSRTTSQPPHDVVEAKAANGGGIQQKSVRSRPDTIASHNNGLQEAQDETIACMGGGQLPLCYEEDAYKAVRGEIALWRAVIMQTVTDALSNSRKREMAYERSQARVWLEGRSEDFVRVCHYADLEPNYVRERCREALRDTENRQGKLDRLAQGETALSK